MSRSGTIFGPLLHLVEFALAAPPCRAAKDNLRALFFLHSGAISGPLLHLPENRPGGVSPQGGQKGPQNLNFEPFGDNLQTAAAPAGKSPWRRLPTGRPPRASEPLFGPMLRQFSGLCRSCRRTGAANQCIYRGLGGAMCVFYMFGAYLPPETPTIIRGFGGSMCSFYVFGRHWAPEAFIIIGF